MVIYGDVTKKKADIFMGNSLSMEAWGGEKTSKSTVDLRGDCYQGIFLILSRGRLSM